jgi:Dehydrogenases with different specificities (related to short-chain alcohol dehydrogenases)
VRAAFEETVLAYGGLDIVVSNAGIAHSSPVDQMTLADWERSFAVNSTGHFLVAREGMRVLKAQGLGGAFVFVATKNVMSPGKDFAAYSAAKAAEAQLAKVLALEGGPHGIRSNIVNPDAVFRIRSSGRRTCGASVPARRVFLSSSSRTSIASATSWPRPSSPRTWRRLCSSSLPSARPRPRAVPSRWTAG